MSNDNTLSEELTALHRSVASALPHINVERDDYCVGYWAREAGLDCPGPDQAASGWRVRDDEIRDASV